MCFHALELTAGASDALPAADEEDQASLETRARQNVDIVTPTICHTRRCCQGD